MTDFTIFQAFGRQNLVDVEYSSFLHSSAVVSEFPVYCDYDPAFRFKCICAIIEVDQDNSSEDRDSVVASIRKKHFPIQLR